MTPSEILVNSKSLVWLDVNQDFDIPWRQGALVASADGTIVARPGPLLSNGRWYEHLVYKIDASGNRNPVAGRFVAILNLAGPAAGTITYVPQQEYVSSWRVLDPAVAKAFLVASPIVPLPDTISETSLVTTIASVFDQVALAEQQSNLGDQNRAKNMLFGKNIGAWALLEKADGELRLLEAFGYMPSKDVDTLREQTIRPLKDAANDAAATIAANSASWLTQWKNWIAQVAKMTSVAMEDIGSKRLEKVVSLYAALVRHNQAEARLLEKLGPNDPLVRKIKTSLDRTLLAQAKVEAKFKEVGLAVEAIKKQAGLQGFFVPIITFLGTKITMTVVLNTLRWVLTQVIIGIVIEAILGSIATKISDLALRELEATQREIAPTATVQVRISERAKLISDSVVENLKALRDLGAGDPAVEAKVNALEKSTNPRGEVALKVTIVALAIGFFGWLKYNQYRRILSGRRLGRKRAKA